MQRMKLFAAPLLVGVGRRSLNRDLLFLPFDVVKPGPCPTPIRYRIAERPSVRRADFPAVVHLVVSITVALGARRERGFGWIEVPALVFSVT